MNQVWVFFKFIEVVLGSVCMFFHMRGSSYWPERIPHVILYCATFTSFTMLAALGAFRLLLARSSVLSSQLLLTLTAVIAHYTCGVLIMRTAMLDPHLASINSTIEYLEHPHFAHCKQQSIAALITGTMYLMHMFHVFDLLMRMEPGDWRRQATGGGFFEQSDIGAAGLFVLSKPVDDFLCRCCSCYFKLAHSQPLYFRPNAEQEQPHIVARMWHLMGEMRRKFFSLHQVQSEESFMSTPTITTSESEIAPVVTEYDASIEEEANKRPRTTLNWRGTSDSSSLWAKIEDRSTLSSTSQNSEATMRPNQMDRKLSRRSTLLDNEKREKSEILLVEQGSSYARLRSLSNAEGLNRPRDEGQIENADEKSPKESRKSTQGKEIETSPKTRALVRTDPRVTSESEDENTRGTSTKQTNRESALGK
ncbi:uncharacterized protein LOC119548772 [Drosophila subpulchrella]|uniref:uncharacterized protein LOC119548772 n=1 Tax=Drosophila subpulchrella TaxID=1486046 RepID=UPI0018A160CB|nr:uncharacterized protein LOC119548772 [Drosophila subpulchrella]